jgi:uncharacterized protein
MNALLITAFGLGLLASAHCVGMCGPLALAIPSPRDRFMHRLRSALLLNGGRVITYGLIGAGFGVFGRGLQLAGLQQVVSIAMGGMILLWLLMPSVIRFGKLAQGPGTFVMHAQSVMARQLKRTSLEGLFFTGMLNGLLPCGMVYLALAGALAQDGWANGALFMVFFGLGTWPALVGLKVSGSYIGPGLRNAMRKVAPYAYAAMAVLFILRGLGLGIPYISPDLQVVAGVGQACH